MEIWPAVLFYRKVQGQQRGARALSHSFSQIFAPICSRAIPFFSMKYITWPRRIGGPFLLCTSMRVSFPCSPRRELETTTAGNAQFRLSISIGEFVLCAPKVNTNSGLGSSMCITHTQVHIFSFSPIGKRAHRQGSLFECLSFTWNRDS